MNFKSEETKQKLSGSYYTPKWIADYIMRWIASYPVKTLLEPSCGDGIFFDALNDVSNEQMRVHAFDCDEEAVNICSQKQAYLSCDLNVSHSEFIAWAIQNFQNEPKENFDAAMGNPPFIRYQYLEKDIQARAQEFFGLLGIKFTKHTNAWIPFVLACIEFLNPDGKIGMVIPSEILHVLYAKELRKYLLSKCSRILLLDPEDIWFEDTLQGAMVLMAEKKKNIEDECRGVAIVRTRGDDFTQVDPVQLFDNADYTYGDFLENKWTYALLTKEERDTFQKVKDNENVKKFSELANVDVGIVTGANQYFLVSNEIVKQYGLQDVAKPMFGRSEHCPGIIYNEEQHQENAMRGVPTNFLWFETEEFGEKHADYIAVGEEQNLHQRYKCRIRKPWYKVPSVYASPLSMLKRSNGMPRLILNEKQAYTTDTAYRIMPNDGVDCVAFVCCFLNTITALSAELEGRHYGGGVLELVPSEIDRLLIPYTEENFVNISELNEFVKTHDANEVLNIQDERICSTINIDLHDIRILKNALVRLMGRRQRKEDSAE